ETATVDVVVNPVVDIDDDDAITNEDVPVKISVLDNDDFEDPNAEITEVTDGTNGTVTINPDGTVTYTPNDDFNGTDTFTYTVTSGGVEETATVDVVVNPDDDITNNEVTTDEDTDVTIPVLDSFEDPDAEVTGKTDGANGTVTINPDGTVTYTPNPDFNGTDTFTYTVTSGGVPETITVEVEVTPDIDIADDNATTDEDVPVKISVLDNDDFEDPDAEITEVTDGANGTVTINPDGTVTYTPNPDFNGTDTFEYTVTSGGVEETATVEVLVNPDGDITSNEVATDEDSDVTIPVLDSFEDPDAEVTGTTDGENGTVTINPDGTVTYTPNPDFNGTDTFTYTVTSGGVPETITVEVEVSPDIDIADDSSSTKEDTPVKISVLDNDEFEGTDAEITGVTNGTNGTVTINPDGTVTYTPNPDFSGTDTFTYTVTSGGVTETATVEVTVDAVPDPTDDSFRIREDAPLRGSVTDTDEGDGPATYALVGRPKNGEIVFNPDGTFTYTPNPDFNGTEEFTYTITDANGDAKTATARIVVTPVSDVRNDNATVKNSSRVPTPVTISALDNDTFEGDGATITSTTQGNNGAVVINRDGTVTYTPDLGFSGTDRFTYTITSGGVTETATIIVNVTPAGPTPGLGSSGGDIVVGTNGDDILNGFSDVDILRGLGGNDLINGGSSEDTMRGDSGNDVLNGGSGNDDMRGGSGNDILNGGSGNDFMTGGNGRDVLSGGTGNDRLYGNAARDILNGGGGRDRLQGGAGRDTLRGGRGNDLLVGGFGRDVLTGGQGRDQFIYTSVRDFGDMITDFEIVKDRINFKQIQQVQSMGDLRFNQRGTDTVVRADLNGTFRVVAVLEDVNVNTMAPRHFIF
ncbi:MAG: Ig-like domain-containing protein, partial [Cyanobacteria bacterium J06638_20]